MLRRLAATSSPSPLLLLRRRCEHTFAALPAGWQKLTVPELEVMDSSEIKSLQKLLANQRETKLSEREVAKQEQRKVLRVNCDLEIRKIDKIHQWTEHVLRDKRREW